jgi:hypothetical protein
MATDLIGLQNRTLKDLLKTTTRDKKKQGMLKLI